MAMVVLFFCGLCAMSLSVGARLSGAERDQLPLQASYSDADIAKLLFANGDPRQTQGYHPGQPSADGWNYGGYDWTTSCNDILYSPLPGYGIVSYNGTDGYVGQYANGVENSELRIVGNWGEVRLLHGKYVDPHGNLLAPGTQVIGGVTQIGFNDRIGNATGCHAHITFKQNPNWQPVKTESGDYDTLIAHYSKQYNLDPKLVHAIIKQESNYNPLAVSSSGAKGLMQIMPITQTDQCPLADLFDPEQNIACGTKHLRWTFDQMGDNGQLGIMAYHSGVTNQKTRGATELDIYYYEQIMRYYND